MIDHIRLFLDHLRIDKGSSEHTRDAYSRDLQQLKTTLKAKPLLDCTESDIQLFLKELKKREQKATSIARKVSALKQFYKFLIQEELIKEDPTLFIEAPVKTKRLPKALDQKSVASLLRAADQGLNYEGKLAGALKSRDRAMIYLLYATGLRVSELINLNLSHIDIEGGYLRTLGKRRKERMVPFAPVAGEIVLDYIENARPNFAPQAENLFLAQRGDALSRQLLCHILKRLALEAGIPSSLHPHMLRHTFATDLLRAGMNLRSLQMLLGHSDMQTTQIYTHVAPEKLQEVIKKYHPRGGN